MPAMTSFLRSLCLSRSLSLSLWVCFLLPNHCRFTELLLHLFTLSYTHTHSVGLTWTNIGHSQRPVPDNTQHSQETVIHDPTEIRTRNPSKRTVADRRLRQHGQDIGFAEFHMAELFTEFAEIRGRLFLATSECRTPNTTACRRQCHGTRAAKYKKNLLGDWCSKDTGMDDDCYLYHLPVAQYLLPGDHANHVQFVNRCNHGHKFCLTFPSRMVLDLAGMVLPK